MGKRSTPSQLKGKLFSKEREETIGKIKRAYAELVGHGHSEEFRDTFRELAHLGRLIGRNSNKWILDKWAKIKVIIDKACQDIEEIVKAS